MPRIIIFLPLIIGVLTSACSGSVFARPTATLTATVTATASPQPTNTATATKTSVPTETPTPPSPAHELPKGTPLAEWSGIPIMPNAIAGESGEPYYIYITRASPEEVLTYYL